MGSSKSYPVTLAAGMTLVAPSPNPVRRSKIVIWNTAATPATLAHDQAPACTIASGIPLPIQNSSFIEQTSSPFFNDIYQGNWWAFSTGAGSLGVFEEFE